MAHLLEFRNGQAAMAYKKGEKPWHGLGVELDESMIKNGLYCLRQAQLADWEVKKIPALWYADEMYHNSGQFHLIRTLDNKCLSQTTVTDRYSVIQNEDIINLLQPLADDGMIEYETMGSIKGGQKVWILARIQGLDDIDASKKEIDAILPFILFTQAHDGRNAIAADLTAVQVVCNNTLTMAHSKKSRFHEWIMHTKSAEHRLDGFIQSIENARLEWQGHKSNIRQMAIQPITKEQRIGLMKAAFGIDLENPEFEPSRTQKKYLDTFLELDRYGPYGEDGTVWRSFSAVTDITSHHLSTRNGHTGFERAVWGDGARMQEKAYNYCVGVLEGKPESEIGQSILNDILFDKENGVN